MAFVAPRIAARLARTTTALLVGWACFDPGALGRGLERATGIAALGPDEGVALAATPSGATPVYVLDIESDDAEDQAEALTSALRSRVRSTPGWTLAETSQTAAALFLALRCPPKPDTACLNRVGDQLKADRYIWGTMTKVSSTIVTVDVHLWARGRAETVARETYSANLQDPGDESLRKVAGKIVERLTGIITSTLVIRSSVQAASVYVDGHLAGQLDRGQAQLTVAAGGHDVELRAPGYAPVTQRIDARAGADALASFTLAPTPADEPTTKGASVRRVLSWTAVGLGAVGIGAAIVETVRFSQATSELNELRQNVPSTIEDVCSEEGQSIPDAVLACRKAKEARQARDLGILFGALGAAALTTGIVLLVTDDDKPDQGPPKASWRITPYVSPWSGGIDARLRF